MHTTIVLNSNYQYNHHDQLALSCIQSLYQQNPLAASTPIHFTMAIMCADGICVLAHKKCLGCTHYHYQIQQIKNLEGGLAELEKQALNLWCAKQNSEVGGEDSEDEKLDAQIEHLHRRRLVMMALVNNLVNRRKVQLWNEAVVSEGTTDEEISVDGKESGEESSSDLSDGEGYEATDANAASNTTPSE